MKVMAHTKQDQQPALTDAPNALRRQIGILLQQGRLSRAAELCVRLNADHPEFSPGWRASCVVFRRLGKPAQALQCAERALKLDGESAPVLLQIAECLNACNRRSEALACAERARQIGNHPQCFSELGVFYTNVGRYSDALEMYERAVALAPERPAHLFNRGTLRRFLGDLTGAEADFDHVISLDPRDYEAYFNRSDLRAQSIVRNHTAELELLLASGIDRWSGQVQVHYALAKEYEDLGAYTQAFHHFEAGAALRRRHLQYDVQEDLNISRTIIQTFSPDTLGSMAKSTAHGRRTPVFIFGLPRSGTTLVERILGCHSAVFPAGELSNFANCVIGIAAGTTGAPVPAVDLIKRSVRCDLQSLGERYLEGTSHIGGSEPYFTDKMPLNFLYCGLIALSLPRAHLIHVTRHPMAVCLAMYKTLFKQGYPFSYSFEEIAQYYMAYRALMDHWKRLFPGRILDVQYEKLVASPREQSERMLEFCGLHWEESCLHFHNSAYPSATASASQVRRPLYQSSVSTWRHYEAEVAPLKRSLLQEGLDPSEIGP
jgi:tetratricopeptide (TPR) repeat protein